MNADSTRHGERWRRRHRLKIILLLGCGVILTALTLALDRGGTLDRLELDTVDARFTVRGTDDPPKDIVVVAINDVTFEELHLRWQDWPRSYHARVLRNLAHAGVKAVIYDVAFLDPASDAGGDDALYAAARAARPVFFATDEVDATGGTRVLGGDENLRTIGARAGQTLLPDDPVRRMWYSRDGLRVLGVVAAETLERRRLVPPSGPTGTEWIDYAGPPGTIDTVSFSRVYNRKVDPARLRGKIVVVGPTAPSLQDLHHTSVGGGQMAGAELQANIFDTARRDFPLRSSSGTLNTLLVVLMGLVAPLLNLRLSPLRALPIVGSVATGYVVAAQLAFQSGTMLLVVAPLLALVLTSVGSLAVDYFTETRERQRLRATFSRFVPEAIVEQVVERGEARLGGERLMSTVLFCDLRGFTSFAETLQAEQVIELLNHYLGEMSDAILNHGGTLVAYMGDGIMAVFGAPIEMEDHADRALAAAREMMGERLPRFNAWLDEQGMSGNFEMGIGLNSGPVMSGNVGSERRMEYTAVGDTTNTAARLEHMTKGTGHQLFVADSTRSLLTGDASGLEHYGDLPVRGRDAAVTVWVLEREQAMDSEAEAVVRRSDIHGMS
jgi:adenylate cyclase